MRIRYVSEWDDMVFDDEDDCRAHEEEHEKIFHDLPVMLDSNFKKLPTSTYEEIEQSMELCWYVIMRGDNEMGAFNNAVDYFGIGTNINEFGIFPTTTTIPNG